MLFRKITNVLIPFNRFSAILCLIFWRSLKAERINVLTLVRFPFVIRSSQSRTSPPMGLDAKIIESFAEKFHLDIDFVQSDIALNAISASEQSKFFADPQNKAIDIFVGGLNADMIKSSSDLVASSSYHWDSLTWCVQAKKPIPDWRNFLYICTDVHVFIIYTLICVSMVCIGYFFQPFDDFRPKWDWWNITLEGFRIAFGSSGLYKSNLSATRIAIAFYTLGSIVILATGNAFMIGKISSTISSPQIGSIRGIIDNHYKLAGDFITLQKLMEQKQIYPSEMLLDFEVCHDLNECLFSLEWRNDLAIAVSREHSRYNRLAGRSHIYCLDGDEFIYENALTFLMRRNGSFLNDLNGFIRNAMEGGPIVKWLKDINGRSRQILQLRDNSAQASDGQVMLENFHFAIILISLCFIAAIATFIAELIIYRKVQKWGNDSKWRLVEKIIDPVRYYMLEDRIF